jgi:hypothetical protein
LISDMKSESAESLTERAPGRSPPSGITLSYWDEINFRVRLTKLPKLDKIRISQSDTSYFDVPTYSEEHCCLQRSVQDYQSMIRLMMYTTLTQSAHENIASAVSGLVESR